MRADRLVAVLMMLQTRGQVTAAEVADELEVSERTARRDLEALGMAGVPVYSRQGRNGGWQLVGGARTDLSGLNAAEARALFLVAGPSSAATPELKAALRKLVRALPETFRSDAEAASDRGGRRPTVVGQPVRPPPSLRRTSTTCRTRSSTASRCRSATSAREGPPSTRVVHPLGLATKGRRWYLVADTDAGLRTFRVDRVTVGRARPATRSCAPTASTSQESWRLVSDGSTRLWAACGHGGTAVPDSVGLLRGVFGNRLRIGPTGADGRVEVEIAGPAPGRTGGRVRRVRHHDRAFDPPELRDQLARIGAELTRDLRA